MANLTKEQRAEKEAQLKIEMEAKIKADLEAKIRAEVEERIRKEFEEQLLKSEDVKPQQKLVAKQQSNKPLSIPLDTLIPVTSNYKGKLTYISSRIAGYTIKWDEFGSTEYIELSELVSMRNSARRFYEDNWIIIEDIDDFSAIQIYDFLKVGKYYENVYTPENIDSLFDQSPAEILRIVSTFSKGMKDTVAMHAKEKIDARELDSKNKIDALSEGLGITFDLFNL